MHSVGSVRSTAASVAPGAPDWLCSWVFLKPSWNVGHHPSIRSPAVQLRNRVGTVLTGPQLYKFKKCHCKQVMRWAFWLAGSFITSLWLLWVAFRRLCRCWAETLTDESEMAQIVGSQYVKKKKMCVRACMCVWFCCQGNIWLAWRQILLTRPKYTQAIFQKT